MKLERAQGKGSLETLPKTLVSHLNAFGISSLSTSLQKAAVLKSSSRLQQCFIL